MELQVNEIAISEMNMFIDGDYPEIPTANKLYTVNRASGADSSVYQENGYDDIKFSVLLGIVDLANPFDTYLRAITFLKQAKTVSLDEWPFYFVVKNVSIDQAKNELGYTVALPVTFTVESFKYLKVNQVLKLKAPTTVVNYGTLTSYPNWTIYGSGPGVLSVNEQKLAINDLSEPINLDSKLMISNHEDKISGSYLHLDLGQSLISWNGGITEVHVEPRWRTE